MSYRIEKGESLAAAFERIAREEIRDIALELRRANRGVAIHNARKSLKRLRALLRCLHLAVPKNLYRRENQRLAGAGRKLSAQRDIQVQLRALAKLRGASQPAGRAVRKTLLRQQARFIRKIPALRAALRQTLRRFQRSISAWPLAHATPGKITAALKRTYKQSRSCYQASSCHPTPENLHEWRKHVKALGYGFELLEDFLPKKIAEIAEGWADLGDALGDDHDLFMVLESLRREHAAHPSSDYLDLAHRITDQLEKLSRHALKLGRHLHREKPSGFEKRLTKLLSAAS